MGIGVRSIGKANHPDTLREQPYRKLIVNHLTDSIEDSDRLDAQLTVNVSTDIDIVPSCKCEYLKSFLALQGPKDVCPICNTKVELTIHKPITPTVFLETPEGIRGMVSILFWSMLKEGLVRGHKKFDTILWLTCTTYPKKDDQLTDYLEEQGMRRGYNNFMDNIDAYIKILVEAPQFRTRTASKDILTFWRKNKESIKTNNIYFLHKSLMIMESNATGIYMNTDFSIIKDAILCVKGIDVIKSTIQQKENKLANFMDKSATFYLKYLKATLSGKKGGLRIHLCGTKGVNIARLVATSITEPHKYDEIEIPWIAGIHLFKQVITNKLLKQGLTYAEITTFIQYSSYTYNKRMADILDSLIEESNNHRIVSIFQRFPTLKRGSLLKTYIVKICHNPEWKSVRYPIMAVRSLNMDFDGDSGHISAFISRIFDEILEPLSYHHNLLSNTESRTLTGNVGLSVPTAITLLNWAENSEIDTDNTDYANKLYAQYS